MDRPFHFTDLRQGLLLTFWHAPFVGLAILFSQHQILPWLVLFAATYSLTRLMGRALAQKKRLLLFLCIGTGWVLLGQVRHTLLLATSIGLWSFILAPALRDRLFLAPFSCSTQYKWCHELLWIGSWSVTLQCLILALQQILGAVLLPLQHPLLWGLSFPLLFTLALSPSPYARTGDRS